MEKTFLIFSWKPKKKFKKVEVEISSEKIKTIRSLIRRSILANLSVCLNRPGLVATNKYTCNPQ